MDVIGFILTVVLVVVALFITVMPLFSGQVPFVRSIQKEKPSKEALKVAQKNAKNNNVDVKFECSDMFADIQDKDFDVIVSNPPYIKKKVIPTLNKEVRKEPVIALDGGEDGLYFYKKIINEAFNFLADNGMIFLEIGYDQKEELIELINADKRYELVKTKKDLGDNDRIVVIKKV